MEITNERLIAAGVAACFCIGCWLDMAIHGVLWEFFMPPLVVLPPLALIWFDEILGGMTVFGGGIFPSESPPAVLRFLGWLFLLGIIGTAIYLRFKGDG